MCSPSARVSAERPFYTRHAEAYDALITDPARPWVDAVDRQLHRTGRHPGTVLDAGCGTGRHARGLIERGHEVELLDASIELLDVARRRCPGATAHHRDLCGLTLSRSFDAVSCRGVLNDLLSDTERDAALAGLGCVLAPGAVLVLDVREQEASRVRSDGIPRHTEVELDSGVRLGFTSRPTWRDGLIEVEEQHHLRHPGGRQDRSRYTFRMRPWTRCELYQRLGRAGFDRVDIGPGHGRRARDHLFVTARRADR